MPERPLTTVEIVTKTITETRRVEKHAFKPSVFHGIGGTVRSIASAVVSFFVRHL